jgi:hypothetical protein
MSKAQDALTAQMLQWIAAGDHAYGEVLEVWKTSCPRLSVWEDACIDGIVDCAAGQRGTVYLTEKGRQFISMHANS